MSALARHSPTDSLGEGTDHFAVRDLIRTGENSCPHYHVIALANDRAWIRDTQHGTEHVVPIDRCHRA